MTSESEDVFYCLYSSAVYPKLDVALNEKSSLLTNIATLLKLFKYKYLRFG